jgi:hypothetical protein
LTPVSSITFNSTYQAIEKKMSKSAFPWKSVFILLLVAAATTISIDIQKHGSFKSESSMFVL